MLTKDNRYKVLKIFFDDPLAKDFQLREISRKISLAPKSVKKYLDELEKESLIVRGEHRIHGYPVYYANRDNKYFKFLKRLDIIKEIEESGLLDYLNKNCMPDIIVLFGSATKGEDVKGSDIDLFLQCKEKKLNLKSFEDMLNRGINIFYNNNFNKLSKELKNNILNGMILKGYLKVFR